jgi:DNA-binding NarL/FixJ family response regulator
VISVLLADDQTLVRDGFRVLLERADDLSVVGEAGDGVEAIGMARALRPDVVLMDIRMPLLDGLTATRRVLALPAPPKVIVLTTFDRNEWVFEALRAGASGFLLKDVRAEALLEAVRVVHRGDALLAPSVTRQLVEEFARLTPVAARKDPALATLTDRERDVLVQIAAGASNAEIASTLFIEPSTVKTHVTRLLAKLGLRDRTQAVVFAYESGLVRPGGTDAATLAGS